jgi:hypothetical protein
MRTLRSVEKLQYQFLGALTDVDAIARMNNLVNNLQNKLETSNEYRKENRRQHQR